MKAHRFIKYIWIVWLSGAGIACKHDFIDVVPPANNITSNFFKDENQFNQAVIGIYNGFLDTPTDSHWNLSEIRSDNTYETFQSVQRDWNEIGNFLVTSQLGSLQVTWSRLWTIVYRSNVVLERIEPFEYAKKKQFQAEARFLRALSYFDLVRYWGPIPYVDRIVTAEQAKVLVREPREKIYGLIVSDLQFAAENLPATYVAADKGRATQWAAKALLGRVYLTMAGYPLHQTDKYALAKEQLATVIAQENTYKWWTNNYTDLFKSANDNKYFLFEIQYIASGTGLGNSLPSEMPFSLPKEWADWRGIGPESAPTKSLINSWEPLDVRRRATIDSGWVTPTSTSTRIIFTKFLEKGNREPKSEYDWPINFPVIRYEDVLLMYAEILNEEVGEGQAPPAEALDLVNRIRNRAKAQPVTGTTIITKEKFRLLMEEERRREFAAEGLRWHDIIRTGRAVELMNQFVQDNGIKVSRPISEQDLIYPIPFKEININPGFWQQNEGYN